MYEMEHYKICTLSAGEIHEEVPSAFDHIYMLICTIWVLNIAIIITKTKCSLAFSQFLLNNYIKIYILPVLGIEGTAINLFVLHTPKDTA